MGHCRKLFLSSYCFNFLFLAFSDGFRKLKGNALKELLFYFEMQRPKDFTPFKSEHQVI
jgi:hypothetical protein